MVSALPCRYRITVAPEGTENSGPFKAVEEKPTGLVWLVKTSC